MPNDDKELFIPQRFTFFPYAPVSFKFHASHFTSGVHYLLLKLDNGREIEVDLSKTYTLESFQRLLGLIPDTIIVSEAAGKDLLAALQKKED